MKMLRDFYGAAIFLATVSGALSGRPQTGVPDQPAALRPHPVTGPWPACGKLALHFEANLGQVNEPVRFLLRGEGYVLFLTPAEAVLQTRNVHPGGQTGRPHHSAANERPTGGLGSAVRIKLLGANPAARVTGLEGLPGRVNYFKGGDAKHWRTNVTTFGRVKYENVWPGVDLVFYASAERQVEHDFVVLPGADPTAIVLGIAGAEDVRLEETGDLVLDLPGARVQLRKPIIHQTLGGTRQEVAGGFVVHGLPPPAAESPDGPFVEKAARTGNQERTVSFVIGDYDRDLPLVIDPVLSYSTYLGGGGQDWGAGVAVDTAGCIYLTGTTESADFPTATGYGTPPSGNLDCFVVKLTPDGSQMLYTAFLGGGGLEYPAGIAVGSLGHVYVTGGTQSGDFPTTNALQSVNAGSWDAFVARLSPGGDALLYSTYLGGSDADWPVGIAVDALGNAYIAGDTASLDFPTTNALQAVFGGKGTLFGTDCFVAKLNSTGSALAYSTFLGGTGDEGPTGLAVDDAGNAHVTGWTSSTNFPTAHALQPHQAGGPSDGFVAKLDPSGASLSYSTYLGGPGWWEAILFGVEMRGNIAVDASGNAYVAVFTQDSDYFPAIPGVMKPHLRALQTAVVKLDATGSSVAYTTFLPGVPVALAVDAVGNVTVAGNRMSYLDPSLGPYFQPVNALQPNYGGNGDAWLCKLKWDGTRLAYATYLGGSGEERVEGIALDKSGNAYVLGQTSSTNFPTTNALQAAYGGADWDAFLTKIADPIRLEYALTLGSSNGVEVVFSEPASESTATNTANYSISQGVEVVSARVSDQPDRVWLTTSPLLPDQVYTLTVSGVQDRQPVPNAIPTNSQVLVTAAQALLTHRQFRWPEACSGQSLPDLLNDPRFPNEPDLEEYTEALEIQPAPQIHYGVQLVGLLHPPLTGDYVFYLCSRGNAELWLSTDESPGNKRRICVEPGGNYPRQWVQGENQAARGTPPSNVSEPIHLDAGRKYYVEALMVEAWWAYGLQNLGVAWRLPGAPELRNGDPPIGRAFVSTLATSGPVAITNQPASQTVNEGAAATFSVGVDGSPPYRYQWYRDSTAVPGATNRIYTNQVTPLADDVATFTVAVSNAFSSATSTGTVLSVLPDNTPPTVMSVVEATSYDRVFVRFSEPLEPTSATNLANYSFSGGVGIIGAALSADGSEVELHTSNQAPGTTYQLSISGIRDASVAGNVIVTPTVIPFTPLPLVRGLLLRENYGPLASSSFHYLNKIGQFPDHPNYANFASEFETYTNTALECYARLSGFLLPPVTGDYVFYLSAQGQAALYLSNDEQPTNKVLTAQEPTWVDPPRQWFDPLNIGRSWLAPENRSAPVHLQAGRRYYIEAVGPYKQTSVTWQRPGEGCPANGTSAIPSEFLALAATPAGAEIIVTQQPQSVTVQENQTATFTAQVTGTATNAIFQWQRNGINIPGAVQLSYTTPFLKLSDNGAKYRLVVYAAGKYALSDEATVTVNADSTPPTLISALVNETGDRLTVTFSEPVNPSDATNLAHYVFSDGLTLTNAELGPDGASVILGADAPGFSTNSVLTVSGVRDTSAAANQIADDSQIAITPEVVLCRGFLRRELFYHVGWLPGLTGDARFPTQPDFANYMTLFETPPGYADYYGVRLSGYVVPPVTSDYVFYLAGVTEARLFLSPDEAPAHRALIAIDHGWYSPRLWISTEGRIFQNFENRSVPIPLQAGRRYYVEAIVVARTEQPDCLAVTWQVPGGLPVVDRDPPISGPYLYAYASPQGASVTITRQPQSVTTGELLPATFEVKASGSSDAFFFQWQKGGVDIPGANAPAYTTLPVPLSEQGAKYRCVVGVPGATVVSDEAVVSVTADTTPPQLLSAEGNYNLDKVTLRFSEPLNPSDATNLANYAFSSGLAPIAARLRADGRTIILTTTPQEEGRDYTVTVNGLRDLDVAGNPLPSNSQAHFVAWLNEEFLGPFASWADVKRDYGAVGDGVADDTAALQKALDEVGKPGHAYVIYVPAGTYRITGTLTLKYRNDVGFVGEHPLRTVIVWDGPAGGVMFHSNGATRNRVGRLTFDGRGRALSAIDHKWDRTNQPFATTETEYADLIIRDVAYGIRGGVDWNDDTVSILRCHFLRCWEAGISLESYNAVDWWVWHSCFEYCRFGFTNTRYSGACHVYESVFRNSTEADIRTGNCDGFFSYRWNTSVNSKAFWLNGFAPCGRNGTVQGNTIIDPQDNIPIAISDLGPLVLLDNVIKSRVEARNGPVVYIIDRLLSVGNTFTANDPLSAGGAVSIDDRIVSRESLDFPEPELPSFLPNRHRPVIELQPGATRAEIQQAINQANLLHGQRPVVHLPAGTYAIDRTLVIPAGSDVQLVGDGRFLGTVLLWAGQTDDPVLYVGGPSHATLRELAVHSPPPAKGIVVANCDQEGARVFLDQVTAYDWGARPLSKMLVDRLDHADVTLRAFGLGCPAPGLKVIGGPRLAAGEPVGGRVLAIGGSSGDGLVFDVLNGGRLCVEDIWCEFWAAFQFMRCSDSGTFTLNGAVVSTVLSGTAPTEPSIAIDDFQGKLAFLAMSLGDGRVEVKGDGSETEALFFGLGANIPSTNNGWRLPFVNASPHAKVVRLADLDVFPGGGSPYYLPPPGPVDTNFIRAMLEQVRTERPRPLTPLPPEVTDLRMFRVTVAGASVGIHLARSNAPPVLDAVPDQLVVEGATLVITNAASDADLPFNELTFSLAPGAPPGATINPTNGVFSWTPTAAQGPSTNSISVIVTDNGWPRRSDTNSYTVVVNEPPEVRLIVPPHGSQFIAPATILLEAEASDVDGTISKVEFLANGANVGEASVPPFRFVWTNAPAGTYAFRARATDNLGAETLSAPATVTVLASLKSARLRADGQFEVTLHGEPGREYWIEASQDLRQWTPVLTNQVDAAGTLLFVDPEAPRFSERFYRARAHNP